MKENLLRILTMIVVVVAVLITGTVTFVDRQPYRETSFYEEMDQRLDSLKTHWFLPADSSQLLIGWASVDITPDEPKPLAGYGARDPKVMTQVMDSSQVQAVVLKKGNQKMVLISADLLIIHPEIRDRVYTLLKGWDRQNVYFTATHTHSGQGGWAPGLVGELFAGAYIPGQVENIAVSILQAIEEAEAQLTVGAVAVGELQVDQLVRNRLVKEKGIIDPWLKAMMLQKDSLRGCYMTFSAHATCFDATNQALTGDYPSFLKELLVADPKVDFAMFSAGAVGSMAPDVKYTDSRVKAQTMATELSQQLDLLERIGMSWQTDPTFESLTLNVPLRTPQFKITENLALRSYLFYSAFGDYRHELSLMVLGKAIFIGLPCDFSGELAVPLYEKARKNGYQLFITSFNGGYAGYVVKDEWYDLNKYEARTMSWHGPDMGSYLTEIIQRLLITIHENNQTHITD